VQADDLQSAKYKKANASTEGDSMHLQRIRAQNFRAFGDGKTSPQLDWELAPGLNILIGENDAGKTSIIDAIRHVLWTTSYEFIRLQEQDFHTQGSTRAQSMFIEATLVGLNADQEAAVLEWLTYEEDGTRSLILHLQARWIPPRDNKRGRVDAITRAGICRFHDGTSTARMGCRSVGLGGTPSTRAGGALKNNTFSGAPCAWFFTKCPHSKSVNNLQKNANLFAFSTSM
jgi:hypothetical protein